VSLATRPLGQTGMDITTVGFGAWAVGGPWAFGWGPQDDDESIAAIHHAVTQGVNWIDTAPAYGLGHSEEVVGRAVAALPEADRPLVFTKCGMWFEEAAPGVVPQMVLRPETIRT
jgi:aryl-alcohol dehydrogenase-like predicted oxidoreductase